MDSSSILSSTTFIYGLAVVFYMGEFAFKKRMSGKAASLITMLAVLANLAGIIARWVETHQMGVGHVPLSNLYESLIFFSFATGAIYLVLEYKLKIRSLGAVAVLIPFIILAYASLHPAVDQEIQPLMPALQSNWLTGHVIACFLGYAAFALAFGISLLYLVLKRQEEAGRERGPDSFFPEVDVIDELIYQMVTFGFFFLSIGIITGAVWANTAWGRYWGWDPKETWSLVTWFVYATLLHARLMRGWQGRRIAWISILGFAAVIFTYFGVNLLPGLHSYL